MSRIPAAALALATLTSGVLLSATSSAHAAPIPTCDGKPATIVGPGWEGTGLPVSGLGTDGDDVFVASPTPAIYSGGGNVFHGGGGNDTICGGSGSDTLYGGDGDDRIFG